MQFAKFLAVLCLLLATTLAAAFESFVVKDIRVEGIQRTDAGTVFSYLPVKVGETMTEEKAAAAIRALYQTGFFKDVGLEVDNGVLIIVVSERPSIAQIDFVGVKEFPKDQLTKGMREAGLAEGRIFDRALLDKAEQELKRQYVSRGKYSAEVKTTITTLERNRVGITFDVTEGDTAKIRQISVVGNKAFSEKELLGLFQLRPPGLMTWYSKADQYSRQKLTADLETLRSFYQNRGYIELAIDSTQVSITPDKKDVYITVALTEGEQFKVADVKFAGEMLIPEAELQKLNQLKKGEVVSREKLTQTTKLITDRLGNEGYAFANVNGVPEFDRTKRLVAFTLFIDPGRRVYVRRINVTGNTRTRDEVIRREMRQVEGGWYSTEKVQLSKQRIERTTYFQDVNVETPAVPGTTDQVDVNVNVTEKPTGNILLGAGYGTEGVIASASVQQQNVFGSGNQIGAQINTSKVNTVYALSFTNPYATVDGVSLSADVFLRNTDPTRLNGGRFKLKTAGASVRSGIPIGEKDTIFYGIGYESTDITTFVDSPQIYINYVNTFGKSNSAIPVTAGWARDSRDSVTYPTRGGIQRLSSEVGIPGGDLKFYKLGYDQQHYFPLTRMFTLMLHGDVGYGGGYGGKPLPFFRNYYAGGVTSVRGFFPFTIGPKDTLGNPTGGSHKAIGQAEVLFPFPGLGLENDKSVRLALFTDVGIIDNAYDFGKLRSSAGFSVTWVSPFGPLKVSLAEVLRKDAGDRTQRFQFQFGQAF